LDDWKVKAIAEKYKKTPAQILLRYQVNVGSKYWGTSDFNASLNGCGLWRCFRTSEMVRSNGICWSPSEVLKCMYLHDSRCSAVILQSPNLWQSHVLWRTFKSLTSSCLQRMLLQLIPLTAIDVSITWLGKLASLYQSPKIFYTWKCHFCEWYVTLEANYRYGVRHSEKKPDLPSVVLESLVLICCS
jgi:hypothetical protein